MNLCYEVHIEHGSGHFSMVPGGFSTGWLIMSTKKSPGPLAMNGRGFCSNPLPSSKVVPFVPEVVPELSWERDLVFGIFVIVTTRLYQVY